MDEKKPVELPHSLRLDDRAKMTVGGVTDVESFDEETVRLSTTRGALIVSGAGLHIEQLQLETGDLRMSGRVDALTYTEREAHRSLFGKLFR